MIITVDIGGDTHWLDTERRPFAGGIPTYCGHEVGADQAIDIGGRPTCVRCRRVASIARVTNPAVAVPYKKPAQ